MEKAPLKNIEDFCKALEYCLGTIRFDDSPDDSIIVRITRDTAKDLIRYLKRSDVIKCSKLIPEHLIANVPSNEIEKFAKREIAYEIANQLLENNYFEFLCREPSLGADMYECCCNCEHSECTNIEDFYFKCKLRGYSIEPSQEPCKDYKPEELN